MNFPGISRSISLLLLPCLWAGATSALASEFKSVGKDPAVMYDAPSAKAKKTFIAPRGMPVEVVLNYGEWSKVRDASGALSWVEANTLLAKRQVVVQVAGAKVRGSAEANALIQFSADKGVLLELLDPRPVNGWLKVKHKDGQTGFIKAAEVWGE